MFGGLPFLQGGSGGEVLPEVVVLATLGEASVRRVGDVRWTLRELWTVLEHLVRCSWRRESSVVVVWTVYPDPTDPDTWELKDGSDDRIVDCQRCWWSTTK